MSASTLSVTANPSAPATRRRTSNIAGDVRQSIDILNESALSPNMDNKDRSHSVRGEAVLERSSKDPTALKKSHLPNPSPSLRPKSRKAAPLTKPVKPVWQTVLRLLTKRLSLLLVLLFLIEMVRRSVVNSGRDVGSGSLAGFSDMEGRIAIVESSLKTTAKMVQVQIEVVDKKVDSLVGDLKKGLSKKIEEKSFEIETRLRKLDEKSEVLEAALDDLKSKDLLTSDDLAKFTDELVKRKGSGDVEVSLDEIREFAREIVEKEIAKHAADGLGMVDYALGSGGAMVAKHSEPLSVGKVANWLLGTNSQGVHKDAEKMLNPSFGEPGQCFPLKGSIGFVQIRLRTAIVPEAITLEHVSKSVAYDRSSAPKDCRVSGWLQGRNGLETADSGDMNILAEFTYDLEKSNAQTFKVSETVESTVIDTIRFEFTSNHGSATHTCIYRLRVHGYEPTSVPMISSES